MTTYFLRRLLLMIPTFIGITLVAFSVIQLVPGGPLEQEMMRLRGAMAGGEAGAGASSDNSSGTSIPAEALEEMKAYYGYDKPMILNFKIWHPEKLVQLYMDAVPLEEEIRQAELELSAMNEELKSVDGRTGTRDDAAGSRVQARMQQTREEISAKRQTIDDRRSDVIATAEMALPFLRPIALGETDATHDQQDKALDLIIKRAALPVWTTQDFEVKLAEVGKWAEVADPQPAGTIAKVWKTFSYGRYGSWLLRIVQLDLGKSHRYSRPVWDVMKSKFPISIYFGLIGLLLSYGICIPLGVWKAVKHGSQFDMVSSVIIFIGYSTPGWALGAVLLVLLGGGSFWDVFPLGGFRSEDFEFLSFWEQIRDQLHHTILPLISWNIASFAGLTVVMKNSLMENLSADYVRTAFAKGLSERRVVFLHALRNSLIPMATGLGSIIGVIFAGSYLIERVFNIDGFGLLGFNSLVNRDYPVVLASMVIGAVIHLTGNIISDIIYAAIDPRIRFR
ncbi:MAG: ABC transporter permease subunit [Calditrichaeota bacterium]|nr:ABC transporter permease subunit [Calditrichota bacterium]MCB9472684.1 ABC transporter permease subunit [Candidatus Delongbacteria bacterium]